MKSDSNSQGKMEGGAARNSNERQAIIKDESWFSQFRNGSNPWMARYVYGLIFLAANLLAWAARDYGQGALTEMESKIYTLIFIVTCFISFVIQSVYWCFSC